MKNLIRVTWFLLTILALEILGHAEETQLRTGLSLKTLDTDMVDLTTCNLQPSLVELCWSISERGDPELAFSAKVNLQF